MRIKMNRSLAGPDVAYRPGQEYDVDDTLGKALCADGRASQVQAEPKPKRSQGKRGGQKAEGTSAAPAGSVEKRG